MTIKSTVKGENVGIIHTWSDIITGNDILSLLKPMFSKHTFNEYKYWVTDFTGVTEFAISSDEIRSVVDLDKQAEKVNPNIIIIVIASKDNIFGLSRMWQIMADEISWETLVVRTKEEADDFLKKRLKEKFNINITNHSTGNKSAALHSHR